MNTAKFLKLAIAVCLGFVHAQCMAGPLKIYGYAIKRALPHDRHAFTQGLFIRDDYIYESTGGQGISKLNRLDKTTGSILASTAYPASDFGEGITPVGNKIVALTWTSRRGLVFDLNNMRLESTFPFKGEGWGIAAFGEELYVSDGSSRIEVLDPHTFKKVREFDVKTERALIAKINELEMIDGDLYANVWGSDVILIIDPASGFVKGVIDLRGLRIGDSAGVKAGSLNGIAFDSERHEIFVTGKNWGNIFVVELVEHQNSDEILAEDIIGIEGKGKNASKDELFFGRSAYRMSTYFVDVGDVSAISVVHLAQIDFAQQYLRQQPLAISSLPIISIASPHKFGAKGGDDFTDVPAGRISSTVISNIYVFENTLRLLNISGRQLKSWLEMGARRFNSIDVGSSAVQELVDRRVPGHDFDTAAAPGLSYEIDVTRPVGHRILRLTYQGKPIHPERRLIVVTNNFRSAGGGGFIELSPDDIVLASEKTNRDVLAAYTKAQNDLTRERHGSLKSWKFTPIRTAAPLYFCSSREHADVVFDGGQKNVRLENDGGRCAGLATYSVDIGGDVSGNGTPAQH